jgi:hypothetical protein
VGTVFDFVSPGKFIGGVDNFMGEDSPSLGEKFLQLLPAVVTILVSASLFFLVPTSWAALPVAAAVMLGVAVPSATWMGLCLSYVHSNINLEGKVIATAMSAAIVVGITVAVLGVLFLPLFAPLLAGIVLSALAIVPVSFFSLFPAIMGMCAIVSEKTDQTWLVNHFPLVSILLAIAFAVSLLIFCSAQTAMLAIFAVGGGCVVLFSIYTAYCVMSQLQSKKPEKEELYIV